MRTIPTSVVLLSIVLAVAMSPALAQSPPDGQLTIAFDASIATSFLEARLATNAGSVRLPRE